MVSVWNSMRILFVSYVTPKGSEMLLVPGMMFTIEPMINEGSPDFFVDEDND